MEPQCLDTLAVGAEFSGIYQLNKLIDRNLHINAVDRAGDTGGTWYWNCYPEAFSELVSPSARTDLKSYPWKSHYLQSPRILAYLKHVVEMYDLWEHFQFNTKLLSAKWREEKRSWTVTLSTDEVPKVEYLIMGLGLLLKTNIPKVPNMQDFQSQRYHTARWPDGVDIKGR
ncbi:hypothetical protein B0J13DRAFT_439534 [Dactylonectria estremocensis]|uniref:Uncharacterized protein n=1 Tax=Dactylonectria estremocensis TaxID=1079267 RepID=A0A9P9J5B9_9HYPO|nr:hypothetical protein B0J13DRAFT_439534 [Dactylonectria estremocensis]